MAKLNAIPLGQYYYIAAMNLRMSNIVSSLIYALEALTNLSNTEIEIIEKKMKNIL